LRMVDSRWAITIRVLTDFSMPSMVSALQFLTIQQLYVRSVKSGKREDALADGPCDCILAIEFTIA